MKKQSNCTGVYFFLLSGENPELAVYEFKTIFSTSNVSGKLKVSIDKRIIELHLGSVLQRDNNSSIITYIMNRVTLVHFCCKQLLQIDYPNQPPSTTRELFSFFDDAVVQDLTMKRSFMVITRRIGEPIGIYKHRGITQKLTNYLGTKIKKKNPTKWVSLDDPEEKFYVILSKYGLWFGQFFSDSLRNDVRRRAAHKRPFFHPSSMNPLLQRTMINLAAIKPGEWLLDPFCGAGGSLLEAARLGIQSVGVEIDRKIIWGAYKNLRADLPTKNCTHLIFGDARFLGFKKNAISAIVTDPPYGTAASTQGLDLRELLIAFFRDLRGLLKPQARVVIAIPSHIDIEDQGNQILNASHERFLHYVHRSLTRKILVFTILD